MHTFTWPIRVYYEDTDAGGVVYHSRYLNFFERARTEALRTLGFEQDSLMIETGVLFAVRSMNLDFHLPARFNQMLRVETQIKKLARASLIFEQVLLDDQKPLCAAEVKVACLHRETFKPVAIPGAIKESLHRVS